MWRRKRARRQSFRFPWFPCRSAERQLQGLSVGTEHAQVTVIPDRPRDSQTSDSDSDGPILYRDEEEEEEEEKEGEEENENSNSTKNRKTKSPLNARWWPASKFCLMNVGLRFFGHEDSPSRHPEHQTGEPTQQERTGGEEHPAQEL